MDTRLSCDLARRQDRVPSEVRDQAAAKPHEWGAKQEVTAADSAVVGELEAGTVLENGRYGERFDCGREVGV